MGYVSSDKALEYYNFYIEPWRNYSGLDWDRAHMFRESFLYELPFERNRAFLTHNIAGTILGGWEIGAVIGLDSGTPMTFTASNSGYNSPGNAVLADEVKPFAKLKGIGPDHPWFDTSAFATPPPNRNGNTGQNMYFRTGQFVFDTNATRSFPIRERWNLRFRLNAFQVTNTPQFSNPNTSTTSNNFGTITKAGGNRQLQLSADLHC
jgi:hypothetical protein